MMGLAAVGVNGTNLTNAVSKNRGAKPSSQLTGKQQKTPTITPGFLR